MSFSKTVIETIISLVKPSEFKGRTVTVKSNAKERARYGEQPLKTEELRL
jgi:hypothetical protein